MTRFFVLLALCSTAFLAACVKEETYPVSGEECAPDDPVQGIDADMANCVPNV